MTLYKFKSLTNFEFVADIIINSQLYAADYKSLNDPMEGRVHYGDGVDKKLIKSIEASKTTYKVCSLAGDYSNPLLWAHYADGFKGVCIEVDIDEDIIDCKKIDYSPYTPMVTRGSHDNDPEYTMASDFMAKSSLSRKFSVWEYEEEVRIFKKGDDHHIGKGVTVKSVFLGTDISQTYKEIIKRIAPEGIGVFDTMINSKNEIKITPYTIANISINTPDWVKAYDS